MSGREGAAGWAVGMGCGDGLWGWAVGSGGGSCHSGGFLLRIMPPSWQLSPARSRKDHSLQSQRWCCRRAILYRHDDGAAAIPDSGPEIKNHCTLEGVFRQIHAVIPKFTP